MTRALVLAAIIVTTTACGGVQPTATPRVHELASDSIELWVDSDEEMLPIFLLDGGHHLLGEEGRYYAIGVRNRTDARIEVVVSVDGRDVISGQVADYRENRGYVITPGDEIRIEGFRRSLDEVASFQFSTPEESYAGRLGDESNVGVIGVAIFDEAPTEPPQVIAGDQRAKAAPAASAAGASRPDESDESEAGLGTRYGESVGSAAEIVPFKRASGDDPLELVALYYDNKAGLEAAGVIFPEEDPPAPVKSGPNPFPGVTPEEEGFAPPPPPRKTAR